MGTAEAATPSIAVDSVSSVPPFEQVRSQIAAQIGSGGLPPGSRLPTVRRLAQSLGLAVNTVAKSYRELEAAGLVETRGRGGTVVSAGDDELRRRLLSAAEQYARVARDVGTSIEEALRIVTVALDTSQA